MLFLLVVLKSGLKCGLYGARLVSKLHSDAFAKSEHVLVDHIVVISLVKELSTVGVLALDYAEW